MFELTKGDHFFSDLGANELFEDFHMRRGYRPRTVMQIREKEGCYTIKIGLPGLRKNNIKLICAGDKLIILGNNKSKRQEENVRSVDQSEQAIFSRTFNLPDSIDLDNISATFTDSLLEIELPKKTGTKLGKVVEIKQSKSNLRP